MTDPLMAKLEAEAGKLNGPSKFDWKSWDPSTLPSCHAWKPAHEVPYPYVGANCVIRPAEAAKAKAVDDAFKKSLEEPEEKKVEKKEEKKAAPKKEEAKESAIPKELLKQEAKVEAKAEAKKEEAKAEAKKALT